MPWAEICALIEPHYPKAGNGRPPIGLERMLRMYCLANWFNLADDACEEALYDIALFRDFCGFDLGDERIADGSTLGLFRKLLETHHLGAAIFAKVGELLQRNGLRLSGGTIVDATLIAAPPSVKNRDKARDPEMHQTKKGNQWHFGMKVHIGVDSKSGLIHSTSVTAANIHDKHEVPHLLHGNETRFYGDSAYRGEEQRARLKQLAPQAKDFTNKRAYRNARADRRGQDDQPAQVERALQGRASVPDLEASLGLCQDPLSRPSQECQPGLRDARHDQSRQVGTTALTGEVRPISSGMRGFSSLPTSHETQSTMNSRSASSIRFNSLSGRYSARTCSAFP